MKGKPGRGFPRSVVRRLTECLAHVRYLREKGVAWVSSQALATDLDLTSSTVRQDLSHLDFSGVSKRGYEADGLEQALARVLGADTSWSLVVVGAGNLGRALVLHEAFPRNGFHIHAVFDADPRKVGKKIAGITVRDMSELAEFVSRDNTNIGVLAVPVSAAQSVADVLTAAGVRGLLNLTLAHISVPPRVSVVDSRIVASLQELAHCLRMGPRST